MEKDNNTLVNSNDDVKKEMEQIIWSKSSETDGKKQETETEKINKVENQKEEEKEKADNPDNGKVGDEIPKDEAPKDEVQTEDHKKRNVLKFGNREWAASLPVEDQFDNTTIFCFKRGEFDKIGTFKEYGKKERIIWLDMFKKDTFELMSRAWAVRIEECEIVEKNGVILNPEVFSRDEKGYHIIKAEAEIIPVPNENKEEPIKEESTDANKEIAAE